MAAKQETNVAHFNPYQDFSTGQKAKLITRQLRIAEVVKGALTGETPIPQSVELSQKGLRLMLFSIYEDLSGLGMSRKLALKATKLPQERKRPTSTLRKT